MATVQSLKIDCYDKTVFPYLLNAKICLADVKSCYLYWLLWWQFFGLVMQLEAMGFDRAIVLEVFFACNKNEELAANYLLDHMHEFEDWLKKGE